MCYVLMVSSVMSNNLLRQLIAVMWISKFLCVKYIIWWIKIRSVLSSSSH